MKISNELAGIIEAIEIWKNACEERGEDPVGVANFVTTDPNGAGWNARLVVVGQREDVATLLEYTTKAVATNSPDLKQD